MINLGEEMLRLSDTELLKEIRKEQKENEIKLRLFEREREMYAVFNDCNKEFKKLDHDKSKYGWQWKSIQPRDVLEGLFRIEDLTKLAREKYYQYIDVKTELDNFINN